MGTPTIKYVPVEPQAGLPAYSATHSTPQMAIGYEARFNDVQTGSANAGQCLAIYCQGSNVASAGQFVQVINGSAVLLDSANSASFFPIGIAGGAMSATNRYGWVGVQGKFDNGAFTNVSFAANARVALASTAGQIGSVTALGSGIRGIILPVSYTSANSYLTVQINSPFIVGITASN
jgi:hypothetical protein